MQGEASAPVGVLEDHLLLYSLLISITSFLITSVWIDRCSALDKGAEVTVEPAGRSVPGSVEAIEGSFFAVVDVGSTTVGSKVMYTVRTADAKTYEVPRYRV